MEREPKHSAAVLNLVTPRHTLRVGPAPEIVIQVTPSRSARPEPPMVNVGSGRGVAWHDAPAADPIANAAGLVGRDKVIVDSFVVEESPAVIVQHAVEINGSETASLLIPKALRAIV